MEKYKRIIFILILLTLTSIILITLYFNQEMQFTIKKNIRLVGKNLGDEVNKETRKNKTQSKYVVLASNLDETKNKFYYFYLPMVAEAWKKMGYKTIIFLVSSAETNLKGFDNNNSAAIKTVEYLKKLDVQLILIKSEPNFGVMTSMISRLFVGAIDFLEDEDYVLTSDSDLVPINKSYYQVEDYNAIGAWNGFCCGSFNLKNVTYEMYPMGHIGMKKKHWKGVMGIESKITLNTKLIADLVSETIDKTVVKQDDKIGRGDQTWYADQVILSSKIQIYAKKTNTTIRKRPYTGVRLDRIAGPTHLLKLLNNSFDQLTDYHAFHGEYLRNYNTTDILLKKLLDEKTYFLMNSYTNEFKNMS